MMGTSGATVPRQIFNPIPYDEVGNVLSGYTTMTGVDVNGNVGSDNCANWTTNVSGHWLGGWQYAGPGLWMHNPSNNSDTGIVGASCAFQGHLICMGKTFAQPVGAKVSIGKLIWLSGGAYYGGSAASPDALCASSKPAGVTTATALIDFQGVSASARALIPGNTNYVRLDGTLVGTASGIMAGILQSGIWQLDNSTYLTASETSSTLQMALTGTPGGMGALPLETNATQASTCNGWNLGDSTDVVTNMGAPHFADRAWWSARSEQWFFPATNPVCSALASSPNRVYCVQTAP
jgi:hypothetical protein